jgi:hypothetical protein
MESLRLVFRLEIIDLAPGGRKSILDRDLGVRVAAVICRGMTDYDVFVGWQRQQDVDLKACAVPMLTRSDHRYATRGNARIMCFELFESTLDACTNQIRRLTSLERNKERSLHLSLLSAGEPTTGLTNPQIAKWLQPPSPLFGDIRRCPASPRVMT